MTDDTRRAFSTAIAQWLEDQGGFPLFTIEGEEPEVAKLSWTLPKHAAKGASDVAEQLGEQPRDAQQSTAGLGSPASRYMLWEHEACF